MNFKFLRMPWLILKDQKENIICTIDDERGDFLGPPHGTIVRLIQSDHYLENCLHHVLGFERQYWQIDIAVDEALEPVVLCLRNTDSEAESSDSDTAKGV